MSLRVLHLASVNYILKHRPRISLCQDPLALVNLGDLQRLRRHSAISFLEQVLKEFENYNPFDDIAIRTAVSSMEHERERPFCLHLDPRNRERNAVNAYEISDTFVQMNPHMRVDHAWLIFGLSVSELFSGNVCSDVYWPDKVIMEVTRGALEPLAAGEITKPETWTLEKEKETFHCQQGNNSPVLEKFIGKELEMAKIKELMTFASNMPCTLEFIYGYIKKIHDFGSLIIDVRVLPNVRWHFCGTEFIWRVLNRGHFFQMLGLISFIAAKCDQLIEERDDASLSIGPEGSNIAVRSRNVTLRSLFDIDVFSPYKKVFTIHSLL